MPLPNSRKPTQCGVSTAFRVVEMPLSIIRLG